MLIYKHKQTKPRKLGKTKGVHEMLVTRKEIQKSYTAMVAKYLANGYELSLHDTARGHQGEEAKTVLTNDDNETVVIIHVQKIAASLLRLEHNIQVKVEKFEINGQTYKTCWLDKGEELEVVMFYGIDSNKGRYETDKEMQIKLLNKRKERAGAKYYKNFIELKLEEVLYKAYRYARKQPGYSRIRMSDILKVQRTDLYKYVIVTEKGNVNVK